MLQVALAVALAAEPDLLPSAPPAALEQAAPAPRWPAALFFTGGGITFWTGAGMLIRSGIHSPCGGCRSDNTGLLLAGAITATVGFASMLAGVFWLVWTRTPSEGT